MKKGFLVFTIIVWYIAVLEFTSSMLLHANRVVYFVITIPLLVIPSVVVNHMINKKEENGSSKEK